MTFDLNIQFEKMIRDNDLDSVVLLAHMNPDGDAAGCVMGLAHYLRAVYPEIKIYPHLAQALDKGPKKLVAEDQVFDPFTVPAPERFGVIVCDTATRKRIIGETLYEKAAASIVLDHHAANEGYGDVNYVKISESCCENLYEILDWERWKAAAQTPALHPSAADYLYMGMLHDTDRFTRASESSFAAAAGLIALGADHKYVMKTMLTATLDDLKKRSVLLDHAKRTLGGQVAYIYMDRAECEKYGIGYEDVHPISGVLRDCEDIQMAFSIYEEEAGIWRCSFRSDGKWIDVNEMMRPLGGGGHAGAAGSRIKTDNPDKYLKDILARIEEMRAGK